MALQRHSVTRFLELLPGALLLDVRSPSEYAHAHLPGAMSLPLFSDAERAQVGTAYKQQSREAAIKIGLDHFGPRMRATIETVERAARERDLGPKPVLCIYCWRGGMRSGAVAWLLDLYGFTVHVLDGGYKSFRNYVLETFTLPFRLRILGGYTGSGKTELLPQLKALGETVVDLEGLACHKGSAFGSIDMPPQPTQELFENLLALELRSSIVNRESSIEAADADSFLSAQEAAKS
ncbi:MAG: tRNA 2-selenouridine(34) synthase MnmH, partial [Chitinophagaceae bacterium]